MRKVHYEFIVLCQMDIVEYVVTVSNSRARACVVAAKRYARCKAVDRDDSSVGRVITLPPIISISPAISTDPVQTTLVLHNCFGLRLFEWFFNYEFFSTSLFCKYDTFYLHLKELLIWNGSNNLYYELFLSRLGYLLFKSLF